MARFARLRKAWRWLRWILAVVASGLALAFGIRAVRALASRLGPVEGEGTSWMPDPGDDGRIIVALPGSGTTATVELPEGIRPQEIRAVEVSEPGEVVVEVLHKPRDRRGMLEAKP